LFSRVCAERGIRFEACTGPQAAEVGEAELAAFRYIEHRSNVALALAVCRELGVPRAIALTGMQKAAPDPGALQEYRVDFFGKTVWFVNGFAANDPVSTGQVLEMALARRPEAERLVLLINTRIDRPDRSRGLGEALPGWPEAWRYILIGEGRDFLMRAALRGGVDPGLFTDAGNRPVDEIVEEILAACSRRTLVVGIGNIAGQGLSLVRYFANRAGDKNG
jgi:poly-gamma-glutamate synthase PgsB/CapB